MDLEIQVKKERTARLQFSDWTQMPDSPLSDAKKQEWAVYRQSLRDLTNTIDYSNVSLDENHFLIGVEWPPPPQ